MYHQTILWFSIPKKYIEGAALQKIDLACELGLLCRKKTPFGLSAINSTFQTAMKKTVASIQNKTNDMVIGSVVDVVVAFGTLRDPWVRIR